MSAKDWLVAIGVTLGAIGVTVLIKFAATWVGLAITHILGLAV